MSSGEAEAILIRAAEQARRNAERHAAEGPKPVGEAVVVGLAERIARLANAAAAGQLNPKPEAVAAAEAAKRARDEADVESRVKASGVPAKYLAADLSDLSAVPAEAVGLYSQKAEALRRLLAKPVIVALCGPWGIGKTWLACALVNHFCACGRSARYADATDYFLAVQSTYGDGVRETQADVERRFMLPWLLVLDEMHERGKTPWEDRLLTRLINKRYTAERATLLISNDEAKPFQEKLGKSVADRINDGGGFIVWEGASLRGRVLPVSDGDK